MIWGDAKFIVMRNGQKRDCSEDSYAVTACPSDKCSLETR